MDTCSHRVRDHGKKKTECFNCPKFTEAGIKIKSVTVENTPSPVSLPAGDLLVVARLAGLGALRRRSAA